MPAVIILNFSASSVEIDSSASTVSLIKTMCAGSSAASMGIGEIRKIYRITNTQNKITSASYYQVVYKYTSENGKAAIQHNCLTVE